MPATVVPALDTAHGELGSRDRLQHTPGGGTVRRATGLSGVQPLQLLSTLCLTPPHQDLEQRQHPQRQRQQVRQAHHLFFTSYPQRTDPQRPVF